jgi:tetratricopeptide (TPR) repeat protein
MAKGGAMAWKTFALGAGLLTLTLAAYLPATQAGFIWDDDGYVEKNPTLRTPDGFLQIWLEPGATPQYYPLVFSSFWVEYQWWDGRPRGYHVLNVLLHGAGAVLLWRVLRRLELPGAWFAAAIFALHPVHVESVAWITERKNVLSGLLFFAALLAYFRFSPPEESLPLKAGRWGWYALTGVLFLGALLSKTVTCSLPAVLVLLWWWKRGRLACRDWIALPPLLVVGAALALVTVWMEKHHVGAQGQDWSLSPVERCLVAGRALWFYAGKLVWPVDLTFIYPRWHIDSAAGWQYLFPLAAVAVMGMLWWARGRLGKGPLVAVLIFAGTLVPALGFFDVYPMRYSFVADHFQYLASAALITLATVGSARILSPPAWLGPAVGGAVLVVLGTLSWRQEAAYTDLPTLWSDTLQKDPDCWMAHYNLGKIYLERDEPETAIEHFARAAALHPRLVEAQSGWEEALIKQGKVEEALPHLETALQINPRHPLIPTMYVNLGVGLARQGQLDQAIRQFESAVDLAPDNGKARYFLGVALAQQRKWDEAVKHLTAALEVDARSPEVCNELGEVFAHQEKWAEAATHFRQAVRLRPATARYRWNLAGALERQGQVEAAAAEYREAQRLEQASRFR